MPVHRLVAVRIGPARRAAKPGGAADERLEEHPAAGAALEGLVVEPGRDERRDEVGDGADIRLQRRPAILRPRLQAVEDLLLGDACVRVGAGGVGADLHERRGILCTRREDAARAMILERARHHVLAVRKQRGGQRIARMAGERAAGEGEFHDPRPVDAAAFGEAVGLAAHRPSPAPAFSPDRMTFAASLPEPIEASPLGVGGRSAVTSGRGSPTL